jgi:hypothetical protein
MSTMRRTPSVLSVNFDKAMRDLPKVTSKVGWFESAKYDDENQTSVAYVAAIQDAGVPSRSIPARPFMQPTIDREGDNYKALMQSGVKAVLEGRRTVFQVMEGLGLTAEADVRKTIAAIDSPPLSIVTLLARKYKLEHNGRISGAVIGELAQQAASGDYDVSGISTKPLNETGHMIATCISVTEQK